MPVLRKIASILAILFAFAVCIVAIVQGAITGEPAWIVRSVAGLVGVIVAVVDRAKAYLELKDKDGKPMLTTVFSGLSDTATLIIFAVLIVGLIVSFFL